MHALAHAAEEGLGVPQDAEEAATWYRRAAEAGHLPAHLHIAGLLLQSRQYTEVRAQPRVTQPKARTPAGSFIPQSSAHYVWDGDVVAPRNYGCCPFINYIIDYW